MTELIKKVQQTGWFRGTLDIQIGIKRAFEGFSGRASETWETQYTFKSNEIKSDGGKIQFPSLDMVSKPYESFDDFIKRVEEKL